ncbi:MAG: hypothetical protein M1817_003257 [Caeruleum heppii]|nr:MAG: hypothetical protein M1817_003257 [Caeruleum heppii]
MPRMVDWSSKLWRFSSENNREGIQRLFSQGAASPWDVNAYGESALHHAATWRHFDLCAFLIDQGAQPLLENQYAKKPIDTAWEQVFLGSLTTKEETAVASLFDDPVYMETRGFTVLHKIVLGLIRKDLALELECSTADINKPDANGRTSLSWAAGRGDVGAVQMLLDAGADHSIADDSFISTLHYAAGHAACTKILLDSGADATAKELFSRTPLHVACYGNKQSDVLDFLLNAGASINETDDDGDPALAYSLMNKQSELTSCLLRRGADMEISNVRGITAIHHAVSSNSHPSLRLLLESGADYTVINKSGQTILHQAANLADTQTMDLLAEGRLHNIDVYRRDAAGKTAEDYLAARAEELTPELKESFDRLMMGLRVKA